MKSPIQTGRASALGFVIRDEAKSLGEPGNCDDVNAATGGQIQAHVVWVDCDDDHNPINTEVELLSEPESDSDHEIQPTGR